ncbi:transglycosylase SLT domain-containing protein [Streptomyces sp. NPDC100445]|uniref:transglycosylase SLT domain-containing protein n=1 Tax=Streptomyces sp. NPDC100445 TaxID=3366102 RepID=UPI003820B44C
MSAKQIAQVAYNAGWRGEELVTATAVALAESSGQYWIVNSIGCVGLWQINVPVHKQYTTAAMKDPAKNAAAAMAIYKGAGNRWTPWEAYTGADGKGSDGPYTAQLGRARMAAAQIKGAGNVSVDPASTNTGGGAGTVDQAAYETISGLDLPGVPDWLDGLVGSLIPGGEAGIDVAGGAFTMGKSLLSISLLAVRASAWLANPKNWLRVVEVIGGGAALFIGLRMLSQTGVQSPVTSIVTAPVTAATKVAHAAKKTAQTAAAATGAA